jgi:peptidyl-prolyl cis-trans isomerase D
VAPQLFQMTVGSYSGPIDTGRTGVVVKILDKQEPSADEIQKNFDQTREEIRNEREQDAFGVFLSGVMNEYKKHRLININAKPQQTPGT